MDYPKLIRRLRIVASVCFALIAISLCVLWVRSYSHADSLVLAHAPQRCTVVDSMRGKLYVGFYDGTTRFQVSSATLRGVTVFDSGNSSLVLPHWCLAFACAMLSALLVWPKRFSLRTLLVTTTLVAVVLGVAVWAVR